MNERNTWGWVLGIIIVLAVIGGIWWWTSTEVPAVVQNPVATTTPVTTGTNPVNTSTSLVNKSSESVASIVAGLGGSTQFQAAWSNTGVGSSITGKGPYTVFVSTDAGYNLIAPGTISSMTAAQKKRMVQYSIVSGRALDIDTQDTGTIKALSGDKLNFSVKDNGQVQINSSFAIQEYKGSNGIVYVISEPLLPPTSKDILTP